jgi:hypothetical protein
VRWAAAETRAPLSRVAWLFVGFLQEAFQEAPSRAALPAALPDQVFLSQEAVAGSAAKSRLGTVVALQKAIFRAGRRKRRALLCDYGHGYGSSAGAPHRRAQRAPAARC